MQMLFSTLLEWGCTLPSSTNKAACVGAALLLLLLLHANHQTTAAAWFQNKGLLLKLGKALYPVGQPVPGRTVGPVPKCRGNVGRSSTSLLCYLGHLKSCQRITPGMTQEVSPFHFSAGTHGFGAEGRGTPATPGSKITNCWKSEAAWGGLG